MKKFISRQKLSKKARKELDAKQRATWSFSPVTKKVESKKLYNRKRKSSDRYDNYDRGFLFRDFHHTVRVYRKLKNTNISIKTILWVCSYSSVHFRVSFVVGTTCHFSIRVAQLVGQFVVDVNSVPFSMWTVRRICQLPDNLIRTPKKQGYALPFPCIKCHCGI